MMPKVCTPHSLSPCTFLSRNPQTREARPAVCSPSLEPPRSAPHSPLLGPLLSPPGPSPLAALPVERGGWWGASPTEEHLLSVPSERRSPAPMAAPAAGRAGRSPLDPAARGSPGSAVLQPMCTPLSSAASFLPLLLFFSCSGFLHDPGPREPPPQQVTQ